MLNRNHIILSLVCIMLLPACKSSQKSKAQNIEEQMVFSLSTTPCFGTCPVFELKVYGNRDFYFEAKENIGVEGEYEGTFSEQEFDAFLGIITMADWDLLEDEYRTDLTDLPSQNFYFNMRGVQKSIYKYGSKPKELTVMSDALVEFMKEKVDGRE